MDISGYANSISCCVSRGFRLQCGGCTSRAQNLKFRAKNFDLHRSDPQRSGTPNHCAENRFQNLILMGVMYFGVIRAGPSRSYLDHLDAHRRSVGLGFELIGAPSLLPF